MINKNSKRGIKLIILLVIFKFIQTYINAEILPNNKLLIAPIYKENTTTGIFLYDITKAEIFIAKNADNSPTNLKLKLLAKDIIDLPSPKSNNNYYNDIFLKELKIQKGELNTFLLINVKNAKINYLIIEKDNLKIIKSSFDKTSLNHLKSYNAKYEVLMRYDKLGKAVGVYICNITIGTCIYINEIDKMHKQYAPIKTKNICQFSNNISKAEIHTGLKGARFHLIIDNDKNEMYWIEIDIKDDKELFCRKENINLGKIFPKNAMTSNYKRFVIIPILINGDSTWQALIIDLLSGKTAIFNVHDYKEWDFKSIDKNINNFVKIEPDSQNNITEVQMIDKGFTKGAWLFNFPKGEITYINNINKINDLNFYSVKLEIIEK